VPELPEVETVRRALARAAVGRRVASACALRPSVVKGVCTPKALLRGSTIAGVERLGKRLAITTVEGRALDVHLGMSGQVLIERDEARLRAMTHVHVLWSLDAAPVGGEGVWVAFRDPRRFGGVRTFASLARLRSEAWGALGPDGATIDDAALAAGLSGSHRAIKSALLDQGVLAGVGNIYADEALFEAGVHPLRAAGSLRPHEAAALGAAIRGVLARAIEAGGSSLRDYVAPGGERGWFQVSHAVYGRGGEACVRCGGALRTLRVCGRTTVMCPRCQPKRGRRRGRLGGQDGGLSTIPHHQVWTAGEAAHSSAE